MLVALINEDIRDIVIGRYALLVQFAIFMISKEDREVAAAFIGCYKEEEEEEGEGEAGAEIEAEIETDEDK